MKLKLALVDDQKDLLDGLRSLLEMSGDFDVLALYHSAEELITHFDQEFYDVVLMDIGLPGINGIECIRRLKPLQPQTQFIVFTIFEDDVNVFDALRAGATGYVLKSSTSAQIVTAIKEVHSGGSPMSSSISRRVINYFAHPHTKVDELPITKRETEILNLLAEGHRYREISASLFISIDTVRTHIRNIYQKLEVTSRTEAINKFRG